MYERFSDPSQHRPTLSRTFLSFSRVLGLSALIFIVCHIPRVGQSAVGTAYTPQHNLSIVPFWDGETNDPSSRTMNRFGGPIVPGAKATVSHTTETVRTGLGAFRLDTNGTIPIFGFDFIALALTGFGPSHLYVDTRDLSRFEDVQLWLRNETGASFSLVFEIKDYRDNNAHRARRRYVIGSDTEWNLVNVPLDLSDGWVVIGEPDLTRAKLFALVIEANQGQAVDGSMFIDDMVLIERGGPLDVETADIHLLVERIAHRQFDAIWTSRDRITGLVPSISSFADVMATNVLTSLIKLLPGAVQRGWVSRQESDAYVGLVVDTLESVMENGTTMYVPPRYLDRVTLGATLLPEESSVDAAMLFLALYQYKSSDRTDSSVRYSVENLLGKFNFAAFSSTSPPGWRLGYRYANQGDGPGFTPEVYGGYSTEPYLISIAAHLSKQHHVDIKTHYHSAVGRVWDYLVDSDRAHLVHENPDFRAPFLQWLLTLFVNVENRGADTFPDPSKATNPHRNAVLYQVETHACLERLGRATRLQPDAGDDGTGDNYQQFSCYNDFDLPDLYMPWSVAFSFLADPAVAEAALRDHLTNRFHSPLGLTDSVQWETGQPRPSWITARHDFWNIALSTMAFLQYLHRENEFLAAEPEVCAALDQVYTYEGNCSEEDSLAVDFGPRGIWHLVETGDWQKISSWDPYLLRAHGDRFSAAFDGKKGLWLREANVWERLTSWEPEELTSWSQSLASDFGSRGLWLSELTGEGAPWRKIKDEDPSVQAAWGPTLVANFDSLPDLWGYDGTAWELLSDWEPVVVEPCGDRLAVGFGPGRGLWLREDETWRKISGWHPYQLECWGSGVAAAFDSNRGFYSYEGSGWTRLSRWQPVQMASWRDKLTVAFGGSRGIWLYDQGGWRKITTWSPFEMVPLADYLVAAFDGGRGIWVFDWRTLMWRKITSWTPEGMEGWIGTFPFQDDFETPAVRQIPNRH